MSNEISQFADCSDALVLSSSAREHEEQQENNLKHLEIKDAEIQKWKTRVTVLEKKVGELNQEIIMKDMDREEDMLKHEEEKDRFKKHMKSCRKSTERKADSVPYKDERKMRKLMEEIELLKAKNESLETTVKECKRKEDELEKMIEEQKVKEQEMMMDYEELQETLNVVDQQMANINKDTELLVEMKNKDEQLLKEIEELKVKEQQARLENEELQNWLETNERQKEIMKAKEEQLLKEIEELKVKEQQAKLENEELRNWLETNERQMRQKEIEEAIRKEDEELREVRSLREMLKEANETIEKTNEELSNVKEQVKSYEDKLKQFKNIESELMKTLANTQQLQVETIKTMGNYNSPLRYNHNPKLTFGAESIEELQHKLNVISSRGFQFRFGSQTFRLITVLPYRAGEIQGHFNSRLSVNMNVPPNTPLVIWYGIQVPLTWIEPIPVNSQVV